MTDQQQVSLLLARIEAELQQLNLWQAAPPSPAAQQSSEPFCIDTLNLSEWLQWILIPRMRALLDGDQPLPGSCSIHPIAQESFGGLEQDCSSLLETLLALDQTLL